MPSKARRFFATICLFFRVVILNSDDYDAGSDYYYNYSVCLVFGISGCGGRGCTGVSRDRAI